MLLTTVVKVPAAEQRKLKPMLEGGWINVHAKTTKIPKTSEGFHLLVKLIFIEHENACRPYVLHRLYRKAAAIRKDLEEQFLYGGS